VTILLRYNNEGPHRWQERRMPVTISPLRFAAWPAMNEWTLTQKDVRMKKETKKKRYGKKKRRKQS
jgi:hypothetical protein